MRCCYTRGMHGCTQYLHCTVASVTEHLYSVDLLSVSTRLAQRSSSSQMQLQQKWGGEGDDVMHITQLYNTCCAVPMDPRLTAALAVLDDHLDGEGASWASAEGGQDVVSHLLHQVAIATEQPRDLAELIGCRVVPLCATVQLGTEVAEGGWGSGKRPRLPGSTIEV